MVTLNVVRQSKMSPLGSNVTLVLRPQVTFCSVSLAPRWSPFIYNDTLVDDSMDVIAGPGSEKVSCHSF